MQEQVVNKYFHLFALMSMEWFLIMVSGYAFGFQSILAPAGFFLVSIHHLPDDKLE